jgi:hypothetical protein
VDVLTNFDEISSVAFATTSFNTSLVIFAVDQNCGVHTREKSNTHPATTFRGPKRGPNSEELGNGGDALLFRLL